MTEPKTKQKRVAKYGNTISKWLYWYVAENESYETVSHPDDQGLYYTTKGVKYQFIARLPTTYNDTNPEDFKRILSRKLPI